MADFLCHCDLLIGSSVVIGVCSICIGSVSSLVASPLGAELSVPTFSSGCSLSELSAAGAALESSARCGAKFSTRSVIVPSTETKFSWNVGNGTLSHISLRSILQDSELPLKPSCSKKTACLVSANFVV